MSTENTRNRPRSYIRPLSIRPRIERVQPKGLPVINLSFNELPFAPSNDVLEAINGTTQAANLYGIPSCVQLRAALSNAYKLNAEQLVCGNGSEELLDIIGRLFASSGDTVLISEFGYVQFQIVANRVGADLQKVCEQHYTTDVDALLQAVTPQTTLLFLANPNNPTGTMVEASEVERLASELPAHTVLVIDLAYGEFAGSNYCAAIHRLVDQYDNVIVTRTFSKAFGIAGLRIGWCHAPEWMIPLLYTARAMGPANAAGQAAAVAALNTMSEVKSRVNFIVSERQRLTNALEAAGLEVVPSQANFLMVATPNANADSADRLADHLFDDAGIVVNQTREAGLERFIRFSVSLEKHNSLLLESIARYLNT